LREDVLGLLEKWLTIACELKREERAASLQFQRVTYETPEDWDRVVECLRRLNGPRVARTVARLVEQWRDYIFRAQLGRDAGNRGKDADCWPMWLLESGLDEATDGAGFIKKTDVWLRSVLQMTAAQFKGQQNLLTMLTCDLMDFHEPAAEYRRLREAICRSLGDSRPSAASRRAWLQKQEAGTLTDRVIQCWTKHVEHLVPDPAQAGGSDYSYNVRWLAALCELDTAGYRKLLNRWKELHKRRRNLWKSIQEHRLPL
jgi:hypothetical protein